MNKLVRVLLQELDQLHLRLLLAQVLIFFLPAYVGSRLRTEILRLIGFRIGRESVFWGTVQIYGSGDLYKRLVIGEGCWINIGCIFDLGATITLGDRVGLGHQVLLLTTSHVVGSAERRAGSSTFAPIHIGDGTWVGARVVILPGITVGPGAIIASGAVVTKDVPPHTMVAGVPAKVIRQLPPSETPMNSIQPK